jgi:raffinose/stachyose/melibiose transport system substrate-binding protein
MTTRWWTRGRIGLVVALVAYLAAAWWMFVRKTGDAADGRTTIRVAHWQIEVGPPEGIEAIIKRYEELNPDIRVEQVLVPGRIYMQWLRTNLIGGTGADIIEYGNFLPGMQDVPIRYFEPITKLLDEPNPYNAGTPMEGVPWRNTFLDGLYNEQIYSPEVGQIYSVTMCQVTMRFFCNEDLLREIIGHDPDFKFPENFDELRGLFARVREFSERTGRPVRSLAGAKLNAQWLLDFMLSSSLLGVSAEMDREGQLNRYQRNVQMDYLRGRWNYQRPELKAALELVREISAEMRPGFIQLERDDAVREFMNGQALFVATGTWDATSLIRLADFPVSIRRFPQPDANDPVVGRYHYGRMSDGSGLTAMALYLNKHSPNREAAIDFMRFMTSVEAGQLFMDHSGWISSIRGTKLPENLEPALGLVDGYSYGGGFMRTGANTAHVFEQNLYLLVGPRGSVENFVNALEPAMTAAQRADLTTDIRNLSAALRPQDAEVMAARALVRLGHDPAVQTERAETLETSQTFAELNIYQGQTVLDQTAAP